MCFVTTSDFIPSINFSLCFSKKKISEIYNVNAKRECTCGRHQGCLQLGGYEVQNHREVASAGSRSSGQQEDRPYCNLAAGQPIQAHQYVQRAGHDHDDG